VSISLVQAIDGETIGSTTNAQTFASANTAGNCIIVAFKFSDNAAFVSLADSRGNTYTQCGAEFDNTTLRVRSRIYAAYNIAGGTNTVTLTISTAPTDDIRLWIAEFSGLATSAANDLNAGQNGTAGSGGSMTSTSVTPSANGELIFGFFVPGSGPVSAGSGFTAISTSGGNLTEYLVQATAASIAATGTDSFGPGDPYTGKVATFKPPGGAAPSVLYSIPLLGAGQA